MFANPLESLGLWKDVLHGAWVPCKTWRCFTIKRFFVSYASRTARGQVSWWCGTHAGILISSVGVSQDSPYVPTKAVSAEQPHSSEESLHSGHKEKRKKRVICHSEESLTLHFLGHNYRCLMADSQERETERSPHPSRQTLSPILVRFTHGCR